MSHPHSRLIHTPLRHRPPFVIKLLSISRASKSPSFPAAKMISESLKTHIFPRFPFIPPREGIIFSCS